MNPNPTPTEPSKRLTPEKLEEIRNRADKAIGGPWEKREIAHEHPHRVYRVSIVGNIDKSRKSSTPICDFSFPYSFNYTTTVDLILNSRQDIPALLSHIQDVEREKERLREALTQAMDSGMRITMDKEHIRVSPSYIKKEDAPDLFDLVWRKQVENEEGLRRLQQETETEREKESKG